MVVNAFILSAWEAEAGNLNQDQPALYSEFQDTQSYVNRTHLKKQNKKEICPGLTEMAHTSISSVRQAETGGSENCLQKVSTRGGGGNPEYKKEFNNSKKSIKIIQF